jgi:hypothetical protein
METFSPILSWLQILISGCCISPPLIQKHNHPITRKNGVIFDSWIREISAVVQMALRQEEAVAIYCDSLTHGQMCR